MKVLFEIKKKWLVWLFLLVFFLQLLLGFALGGHRLHGFLHRLLVAQEGHGLDGLQVGVQLVHDGDPRGQVQLHDGGVGHPWRETEQEPRRVSGAGGCSVKGGRHAVVLFGMAATEQVLCRGALFRDEGSVCLLSVPLVKTSGVSMETGKLEIIIHCFQMNGDLKML